METSWKCTGEAVALLSEEAMWLTEFKLKVDDLIQHWYKCPIAVDSQFVDHLTRHSEEVCYLVKKKTSEDGYSGCSMTNLCQRAEKTVQSNETDGTCQHIQSNHPEVITETEMVHANCCQLEKLNDIKRGTLPVDSTCRNPLLNTLNGSENLPIELHVSDLDLNVNKETDSFTCNKEDNFISCRSPSVQGLHKGHEEESFASKSLVSVVPYEESQVLPDHWDKCKTEEGQVNNSGTTSFANKANLNCQDCGYICRYPYQMEGHRRKHSGNKLKCDKCCANFSSKAELYSHVKWKHMTENQNCEICGHKFLSRQAELRHYRKHHPNVERLRFKCDKCSKLFSSKIAFLNHQQTTTGHSKCEIEAKKKSHLICSECDVVFSCTSDLRCHLQENHGKIVAVHQCDVCGKSYSNNRSLREHKKAQHGSRSYSCPVCGAGFKWRSSLLAHKLRCDGTPKNKRNVLNEPISEAFQTYNVGQQLAQDTTLWPQSAEDGNSVQKKTASPNVKKKSIVGTAKNLYACTSCNFKTFRYDIFKLHVYRHTDKSFSCSVCGNKYTNLYYLRRHERVAHEIGGFLCDICGRHFFTKAGYDRHLNSHNNVYPFRCEVCGKGFHGRKVRNIHFLARHRMKYACDYCECRFMKKSEVKKHTKTTHKDLMKKNSVSCNYCGKMFLEVQCLQDHIKSLHGPNPAPFSCECGKTFRWRSSLASHRSKSCKLRGSTQGLNITTSEPTLHPHVGRESRASNEVSIPEEIPNVLDQSCVCGKAYQKKSALGSHRVHCIQYQAQQGNTLLKPKAKETYQCSCGMRSKWRSAFRVHCRRCPDYLAKCSQESGHSMGNIHVWPKNAISKVSKSSITLPDNTSMTNEAVTMLTSSSSGDSALPIASVMSQFPRMPVTGPVTVWLPNGAVASVFSAKPSHGGIFPPPSTFYPYLLPCSSAVTATESLAVLPGSGCHGNTALAPEIQQNQNKLVVQASKGNQVKSACNSTVHDVGSSQLDSQQTSTGLATNTSII